MARVDTETLIDAWRRLLAGSGKPWVLFEHGTCVVLEEPESDLADRATEILREYGPVSVSGPSGDFRVLELKNDEGWLVTGHHPDVVTFVALEESEDPSHLAVGIHGRAKRDQDGRHPHVVHVEDVRPAAG
ncbi:hypothetical protein [Streptomyces broussonetiae]|uniref:Uncharacterized protein n=1 Tax=Streptomyces broussonetiae TaxID=2686304 RepID=A0A6I6NHZ1_9ACTN|nr:hypothetical protein [Streptomyces broussonetiae]QHA09951.1 hypothetical protein GQF42_32600 [Streptomyces broussonetiae]